MLNEIEVTPEGELNPVRMVSTQKEKKTKSHTHKRLVSMIRKTGISLWNPRKCLRIPGTGKSKKGPLSLKG